MTAIGFSLAFALAMLTALPAAAEKTLAFEVGGGLNYHLLGEDWGFGDGLAVGGFFGVRCSCGFGAELTTQLFAKEEESATLTMNRYALNGLYHFNREGIVQPYLSLGWGQWSAEVDYGSEWLGAGSATAESTFGTAGVGLKIFPNRHFIIRPAVDYMKSTENEDLDITTVGVSFAYSW